MRNADPLPPPCLSSDGDMLAKVLGASSDPEFDAVTAALASLTGCRLAFLALVDGDRLWFKSSSDGPMPAVVLEQSFCSSTLRHGGPLVIADAAADPLYAANPFVVGEPFIRFYAGVPLVVGARSVGTLCVVDQLPHAAGEELVSQLASFAVVVSALIAARLAAAQAKQDAARLATALAARDRLHCQLQQAERMAEIGSWRLTVADGALDYSDQVYAIHDLPAGDPGNLADALRFYPEPDRGVISAAVEQAITQGRSYDLELNFVTATGRQRRVRAMAEAEVIAGEVVALVGVFQDVTERHRQQQALEHAANTDPLTQLGGRRGFTAALDNALASSAPHGEIALALIDLDHFKQANDHHGHAAGDAVLREVGQALQAPWLRGSYAARLGGDEFALVVADPALLADLWELTDRLLRELVVSVGTGDTAVRVTATLGICHGPARDGSRRLLLERADAALYHAKREQRGTAAIRRFGFAAVRELKG